METYSRFMAHYWFWLLTAGFMLFAVPEGVMLATGRSEDTLSGYIWRTFGVIRHQPISDWSFQHFAFVGMFSLTAVWLIGHFGFRMWT